MRLFVILTFLVVVLISIVAEGGLISNVFKRLTGTSTGSSNRSPKGFAQNTVVNENFVGSSSGVLNVTEMIKSKGYPVETYEVQTEDGYLLTIHRIPYGLSADGARKPNKSVVFLQHGLLSTSSCWILTGPNNDALAYMLADAGYDVWMGNARGNSLSRKNVNLDPDNPTTRSAFWSFSWHEIGFYDLPAMLDFSLKVTGRTKLHYVGHSQGTTSIFVLLSLRQEYNAKFLSVNCLAPVVFMSNLESPIMQFLATSIDLTSVVAKLIGVDEFLPSNTLMQEGGQLACMNTSPVQEVCSNVLFLICGYDSEQLNRTTVPPIMANTPAGAATRQLVHYAQEINSGHFRQYDYGLPGNMKKYNNSATPPDYPLNKITAPIGLYYANNDILAAVQDVQYLLGNLTNANITQFYKVPLDKFNHLDFLWAVNVKDLVYNKLIEVINSLNV